MWPVLGVLFIAIVILIIEVPSLWKAKMKKELWIFSLLLLFSTVLGIAKGLQMDIPNPLDWLAAIFEPCPARLIKIKRRIRCSRKGKYPLINL